MKEYFYLNGEVVTSDKAFLHVTDLGLLRGYGIFDFFRAIDGQPVFMEDHLNRFERSAALMRLTIPESRERLREIVFELVKLNNQPLLGIKFVLTGGYSPDGFVPTTPNLAVVAKPFKFAEPKKGMKLLSVEHQRELPEIKTTNYIMPIWVLPQMQAIGADDVLYHKDGFVTESSRSNIFVIKNDKIITAQKGVLHGITRKHILDFARQHFEVEERDLSVEEFWAADEVFTCGSTKRIVPITHVDQKPFGDGNIGKTTEKLQVLFMEHELANGH
jgi:branched-chain amino acid aminotransferase